METNIEETIAQIKESDYIVYIPNINKNISKTSEESRNSYIEKLKDTDELITESDYNDILIISDKVFRYNFVRNFYNLCNIIAKNNYKKQRLIDNTLICTYFNNNFNNIEKEIIIVALIEELGADIFKENEDFKISFFNIIEYLHLSENNVSEDFYNYLLNSQSKRNTNNLKTIKLYHNRPYQEYLSFILDNLKNKKNIQQSCDLKEFFNFNKILENNRNIQNNNNNNNILTPLEYADLKEDFEEGRGKCRCNIA